jgi:hypothetical protein
MLIDLGGKKLVMAKNKEDDTALHDFCCQIKRHTKAANKIKLMLQVAGTERLLKEKNDEKHRIKSRLSSNLKPSRMNNQSPAMTLPTSYQMIRTTILLQPSFMISYRPRTKRLQI